MFEDSLVESRVYHTSSSQRWTTFLSISLQCGVAALVLAMPLLHPESMGFRAEAPKVWMPLQPKPPVHVERAEAASTASTVPTAAAARPLIVPSLLPSRNSYEDPGPPAAQITAGMGSGDGLPDALRKDGGAHTGHIDVAPVRPVVGPVKVSEGVSAGMLISPIRPVYPSIARAAGVQGTVVVEAVISSAGRIESLHVVSGPPMLRASAIEAIQAARYEPFRLNGEPTDVQTTITVNFRIGG